MGNILTHNTNLAEGTVQTYAEDANVIVLDLNKPDFKPLEMSQLQALGLSRIIEAAIRDAQQGTYVPPAAPQEAGA